MTDYDSATYYECGESETLTHESPEEALEAFVESWQEPGLDTMRLISERAPVTVLAYRRDVVSQTEITQIATYLLEHAAEHFSENWGDPDGDDDGLDAKARDAALEAMRAAVNLFYSFGRGWSCSKVGERTYSGEELEEMMREYNPDWFKATTP